MSDRTKIAPLTSSRFIAAFLIVLAHSSGPAPFGFQSGLMSEFILGSAGVSFFFVLSGFILTYTYGRLETTAELRNFWAARFARIWPTHALTFFLCLALFPVDQWAIGANPLAPGLVNLALAHAAIPIPQYYFAYNAPSWSISTEAYFYLLYPLAAFALARRSWLLLAIGALAVVAMMAISIAFNLPPYSGNVLGDVTSHGMISIHPAARFLEFAVGMVAAHIWMQKRGRINLNVAAATALEIAALILVVASVIAFQFAATALEAQQVPDAITLWIHFSTSAIPFAALIFVLALNGGYISKILSLRPMVILGEISFALYMLHQVALRFLVAEGVLAAPGLAWPMFALFSVVMIGMSYAVWVVVERPARRGLNHLLQRGTPALKSS